MLDKGSSDSPAGVGLLAQIRTLLVDMDGVIYFEERTLPGVCQFLDFLRCQAIRFAFVTNGTGRWPEDHRAALAQRGISADDVPIYTAGMATAQYLARQGPGRRVYLIGEEGFGRLLVEQGGCLLDDQRPDFVVLGWTSEFDYEKLARAVRFVHRGAQLIVGDPDVNDPAEDGPTPGAGAFAAAIEAATGATGIRIGKPSRALFDMALRGLGADHRTSAVLGDRLDSDIRGGLEVGITTILILTGITTPAMVERSPLKPHIVVRDLDDLRQKWLSEIAR